jgi:hypothetical protein
MPGHPATAENASVSSGRGVREVIESHLGSPQVSRVIYGAIIGLALLLAVKSHPPKAGVIAGTLLVTGLAVGLAELYSEIVGMETRTRHRVSRHQLGHFRVSFPSVFFILAAFGAMELETAFELAKWTGLGLIAFYGYAAGRLAGESVLRSLLQAAAVTAIGGLVIGLKAVIH